MNSLRARWAALRAGRRAHRKPLISIDDPTLETVVTAFDDTEAASSALARSDRWRPGLPAVLRHHLTLPDHSIENVRAILATDGWELRAGERGDRRVEPGHASLVALRVQKLDALHCSQESSRMAGLAQRHGGRAFGWDALQPAPE